MKDKPTEEQILKWLDGDSTPEIDAQLQSDPEMLDMRDSQQAMLTQLSQSMPASVEPPYADFLNSRIEKEIRSEEAQATAQKSSGGLLQNFKWLWGPAAAAACFVLGMKMGTNPAAETGGYAVNQTTIYTPDGNVSSRVMTGQSTVIVLDGLSAIPDSVDLLQVSHSSSSSPASFLVSTDDGASGWSTRDQNEDLY